MTIGNCDCCPRRDVPGSVVDAPGEPFACYVCQGDGDPDPYCELEQYDAHVLAFRWHEHCWMAREYRHAGERYFR